MLLCNIFNIFIRDLKEKIYLNSWFQVKCAKEVCERIGDAEPSETNLCWNKVNLGIPD
jgi:hypothetical protein